MIVEWFLGLAGGFVEWLASLFGPWEPPAGLMGAVDGVASLLASMAGFGVWVDFGVLSMCVGISVASWLAVLGIKLVRAVLAHVPMFGGAGD